MSSDPDNPMHGILTIARLTWVETRRARIALAALIFAVLFLIAYGIAVYFLNRAQSTVVAQPIFIRHAKLEILSLAGLYVANFLTVALAVMLPVDSISGELESGVMETLAAKPITRATIVLGKWLAFFAMTAVYLVLVAGGVVLLVATLTGFRLPHLPVALSLMFLGATTLLTLSIAGGTRFKTVTNGIVAFGFYALAFIGGWVEQIGFVLGNGAARYIGTAISLVSPVDSMWRLACYEMQSPLMQQLRLGPFSTAAVPSTAMVVWATGFVMAALLAALWQFRSRSL